jgi:hypothetical protein
MQWEQLVAKAGLNRASQADCGTHSGRWRFLPKFNQPNSIPPIEMTGWVNRPEQPITTMSLRQELNQEHLSVWGVLCRALAPQEPSRRPPVHCTPRSRSPL